MATVGTQLTAFAPHYNNCPSLQHSGPSSPAQLALFANPLQDTISMLHEGLAVSPTVNQSHVGFLGMVSVCHMWLDDAYATCLGSHSLGTARTQWQAAFVSALACKLSRYEFAPYTYTHARTSFKSVKHWQAYAAADASLMLCFLVQVWPLHLDCLSGAANLSPTPACSSEDNVSCS
jgi:hypothetical protein